MPIENNPLDTELRTVRKSELEAVKAALELAQHHVHEREAAADMDEIDRLNADLVEIAGAVDLVRQVLRR